MGCDGKIIFAYNLALWLQKINYIDASLSDRDLRSSIIPNIANIFLPVYHMPSIVLSTFLY